MSGPYPSLPRTKQILTTVAQRGSLLQFKEATRSLTKTKQLHAYTIISGLPPAPFCLHTLSNFVAAYASHGHIPYARKLFDELPDRKSSLCNAVIRMYIASNHYSQALHVFVQMLGCRRCPPDSLTYTFVLKACSELLFLDIGSVVHGRILVSGFDSYSFVRNALLALYGNCGEMVAARKVFDEMQEWTVTSWNTMINAYFKNGFSEEAAIVFEWMVNAGVEPDGATAVAVLPACGYLKKLDLGRYVHKLVDDKGLGQKNIAVYNALINMYAKCGKMNEARAVMDRMDKKDVVTWTTIINGYILNADARSAMESCRLMQFDGVNPNPVTIASLLSACCSSPFLKLGKCLHGWSVRRKLESDVLIETALIDMYANCKHVDFSFQVLARTSKKRTIPCNAILSGCVHNGLVKEAMEAFKKMLEEQIEQNLATLKSLLPAYAIQADLRQAMNIHCYLVQSGFVSKVEVITGLIDVYSKCGHLEAAHKLFNDIPLTMKDIISWSTLIAGYGMHGHGEAAVSLFHEMVQSGVKPNEVTFTSVLHACSHAGLVDAGFNLFKFMLQNSQVPLHFDHYTCMVDLLGRAGRLQAAYDLIRTMPFAPNHAVWGALLGGCVIHENVELGEVAAKWLFELEPENTGNYVLLANIYSALGRWKDAEDVRHIMNKIGLRKAPAGSLV